MDEQRVQEERLVEQFDALIQQYNNLVCTIAWRHGLHPTEVDDVRQDVFTEVWCRLGHPGGWDITDSKAWLTTVTLRMCALRHRREVAEQTRRHAKPMRQQDAPERCGDEQKQLLQVVKKALEALPAGLREAIVATWLTNVTVTEWAEEVGISVAAARQRRSRGLRLLRENLAEFDVSAEEFREVIDCFGFSALRRAEPSEI